MGRLLAWNGSAWIPAKLWNGSAWVGWQAPVYGAGVYSNHFSGTTDGWVANGPNNNGCNYHSNGHIYTNLDASAYSTSSYLGKTLGAFSVKPGQTIRLRGSVLVQKTVNAGVGTNDGSVGCRFSFRLPGDTYDRSVYASTGDVLNEAGYGWAEIVTDVFTVPYEGQEKPVLITPNNDGTQTGYGAICFWAEMGTGALGPFNKYNFYIDWAQLEDSAGNILMQLTQAAVDPIRIYDSAGAKWL